MGMYDRDWYRDHHRKLQEEEEAKKAWRLPRKQVILPRKGSFSRLLAQIFLLLGGCWGLVELGLKLKG